MTAATRANTASSFTIIKGALIEESYAILAAWDFARSKRENLAHLVEQNYIGAGSSTWLRDVAKVVNRRFEPNGRDRPLVILAKYGCPLDEWTPILLWHITRDEFLLRDFLETWLFPAYEAGAFRVHPEDVIVYLRGIGRRGAKVEHAWTDATQQRVAVGLLKLAVDFGFLRGGAGKEFTSYHLPDRSFLYLLHAMYDQLQSASKVFESPDWRMFLMRPADVENEVLRLHQFRKLEYQVAGSLMQLELPCAGPLEYAEAMAA